MKTLKNLFLITVVAVSLTSCATKNATTGSYEIDPRVTEYIEKVKQAEAALAPVNPYAALTRPAVEVLGALALGISTLVVGIKNRNNKAAAASLAQTVVASGLTSKALQSAVENKATLVAEHINNSTVKKA